MDAAPVFGQGILDDICSCSDINTRITWPCIWVGLLVWDAETCDLLLV